MGEGHKKVVSLGVEKEKRSKREHVKAHRRFTESAYKLMKALDDAREAEVEKEIEELEEEFRNPNPPQ